MIELKDVNFKYKNGNEVIHDINFEIKEGEIISIVGKNGSGKSSLLKLIAGITKPKKGTILVDNIDVNSKEHFFHIRKKVGIVFQNPENQVLFPRVYDDIEFALKNLEIDDRKSRIEKALKMVNMHNFKESDTYDLSLGQKQRVNIASVLAVNPQYVVMDEPTTMIDSNEKEEIYKVIKNLKKEGHSVIFVTNNANEILLADKVLVLENGRIKACFGKEKILENADLLKECEIRLPDILEIVLKLKENGVNLNLEQWSREEIMSEIVKIASKG